MDRDLLIPIALFFLNIPLFFFIGKRMFGYWGTFFVNFRWNFVPDWYSLLTGRFLRDMVGENRSGIYLFICLAIYLVELIIVSNIL